MISFPNAKINLGLNIVSKRPDGYHNIETVFYPVPLRDALEIVPASPSRRDVARRVSTTTTFTQTGIPIAGDTRDNLVMKAYQLLKAQYEIPEIAVYLQKNIPFGAGLGGGSADAAFMLKLLNDFAELHLSPEQLEEFAARLGADCPFFIQNKPVFAEGTGTVFSPVQLSLSGYYLSLVKPEVHVSTQEAYAGVKPQTPKESIRDIICDPVSTWKDRLVNDFETSIFARFPEIGEVKQKMYDQGAIYASMSGSGSSVFGLFETLPEKLFPDSFVLVI
jgi:4-diphosphocytidyl-2-C-methyl-D-erythritol kinase